MRAKRTEPTITVVDLEWTVSFLLTSIAVITAAMAAWAFGTDLGWAEEFPVSAGTMAHWQPWAAMAALGETGSLLLRAFAHG